MRGRYILCVLVAALGGELLLFHYGSQHILMDYRSLHLDVLASVILSLLTGLAALMGVRSLRRRSNAVAEQLRKASESVKLTRVDSPHPDLSPLVWAVNDVMEMAEKSIAQARLQAKELEIQLKVATAERHHAEAIIHSISDAVLVTDRFDELVLANEAAARALDFDLDRAQRAPVGQVLRDAKLIEMIQEMRQSNSRNERRIVDHAVRTVAGERTFKVTLSCVADRNNQPAGVVAVLHDMTREREIAQIKNDFVSNVSHELRTPLASIKAYVEMLIDGEADDDKTRQEFYEVIQNESNRLSRLIDDILNISRIESGLVKIVKHPQSLTVILKEAMEVIAPQAKQRGIAIDERLSPIFYQTQVDRDMMYQAALNLLSNAVKYTPEGGVIIIETVVEEQKKSVTTRISDTGVGIPAQDLPFVFDKFYRAEANNRMAKGTGLGLSLVKQVIETIHGGKVFVESQVGK